MYEVLLIRKLAVDLAERLENEFDFLYRSCESGNKRLLPAKNLPPLVVGPIFTCIPYAGTGFVGAEQRRE